MTARDTALVDAVGTLHRPADAEPRIVSLVPSLTELVCELGLAARLVGRTGFCIHPKETLRHIPKVGGTKDVKIDRVRALAPTHVIVNIDENRREDVEAIAAFVPHVIVTHPLAPEDNVALYALLGGIFGCGREAARLTQRFRAARERLARATAGLPREKVLYLIWRAPWMSIGRRTYISAMLEAAGWDSLPDSGEARYPVLELTEPWLAPVQRVLLPGEPYPFRARHARELATLPALAGKPVLRIDGEMTSWYGSRAVAGMDYLARLRLQQDPGLG